MKKPTTYPTALVTYLVVALLPLTVGALGGALLFSADAPAVRGFGLALIVLLPLMLRELTRERG